MWHLDEFLNIVRQEEALRCIAGDSSFRYGLIRNGVRNTINTAAMHPASVPGYYFVRGLHQLPNQHNGQMLPFVSGIAALSMSLPYHLASNAARHNARQVSLPVPIDLRGGAIGDDRQTQRQASPAEEPNVVVSISESYRNTFADAIFSLHRSKEQYRESSIDVGICNVAEGTTIPTTALVVQPLRVPSSQMYSRSNSPNFNNDKEATAKAQNKRNKKKRARSQVVNAHYETDVKSTQDKHADKKRSTIVKPKRPLNCYNLFFLDERARNMFQELPSSRIHEIDTCNRKRKHVKTASKQGFLEMSRACAQKWKIIDLETRIFYDTLAKQEEQRFNEATKVYEDKLEAVKVYEEKLKAAQLVVVKKR